MVSVAWMFWGRGRQDGLRPSRNPSIPLQSMAIAERNPSYWLLSSRTENAGYRLRSTHPMSVKGAMARNKPLPWRKAGGRRFVSEGRP